MYVCMHVCILNTRATYIQNTYMHRCAHVLSLKALVYTFMHLCYGPGNGMIPSRPGTAIRCHPLQLSQAVVKPSPQLLQFTGVCCTSAVVRVAYRLNVFYLPEVSGPF